MEEKPLLNVDMFVETDVVGKRKGTILARSQLLNEKVMSL